MTGIILESETSTFSAAGGASVKTGEWAHIIFRECKLAQGELDPRFLLGMRGGKASRERDGVGCGFAGDGEAWR